MLYFGIDTVTLAAIGTLCVLVVAFACKEVLRVTSTEGRLCIASSAFTAIVMLIAYVVMARVLDNMVGVYGW